MTKIIGWLLFGTCCAPAAFDPTATARQPLPDIPFLQETGRQIKSVTPLTSVAVLGEEVFVGTATGLLTLDGERLTAVVPVREPIRRLVCTASGLWALADQALYRYQASQWTRLPGEPVTDLVEHQGNTLGVRGQRLYRWKNDLWEPWNTNSYPFGVTRLISHCDSLYVQGSGKLALAEPDPLSPGPSPEFPQAWDWGALPSVVIRDTLSLGAGLYLATDRGLGLLRGMSLTAIRGVEGLPYEDTTCLARGFTNDLWIGTTRGAIRMVDGAFHYFAGRRWLPDDRIHGIAAGAHSVYVATEAGLGIIDYAPLSLADKAAFYERHLERWGQKRLGLVHKLEWDRGLQQYVREVSDNDGGYSGDYLAAQTYRFAVTGDPQARREASNTFQALRWLERMTGIPGFPARSAWVKGERGHKAAHGSGGYPAEWHDTADGRFEWKGDTSSDEICSHFYAVSLFLELAAQTDERQQAIDHLSRIATHLIDHRWQLIDLDDQPTRWGRWDPEYFHTEEGQADRGLQCLEILSFVKTAADLTSAPKFSAAYESLVRLGYPQHVLRQCKTFPPEAVVHFDDQLAFWGYWNLLRREQEPGLRSLYRRSFERTWELLRVEQQPWFNFVYGALTGNECEAEGAVRHLREWPLDLVVWSYANSHRADLRTPPGYGASKGGVRPFSPREREPMRWDAWTMQADGGSDGQDVVEPSGWLVAYWMARYYGFLAAPAGAARAELAVEQRWGNRPGAEAYSGPPRP